MALLEEVLRGHGQDRVFRLDQLLDGVGERRQVFARQLERVDVCSPGFFFFFAVTPNVGRWICMRKKASLKRAHRLEYTLWVGSLLFFYFSSRERRVAEKKRLRQHRHAHARVTTTSWPRLRCQVPSYLRRNCTIADATLIITGICLKDRMDNKTLGGRERSSGR